MKTKQEILKEFNKRYHVEDDWDFELYQKTPSNWKNVNREVRDFIEESLDAIYRTGVEIGRNYNFVDLEAHEPDWKFRKPDYKSGTNKLVVHAPKDPLTSLVEELEKMKKPGEKALGWTELKPKDWGYNQAIYDVLSLISKLQAGEEKKR